MKKITKNTVKAIIKKEGTIKVAMLPCKANPNSMWISPISVTINSLDELEKTINEYTYYNCNNQLGNYPAYYID